MMRTAICAAVVLTNGFLANAQAEEGYSRGQEPKSPGTIATNNAVPWHLNASTASAPEPSAKSEFSMWRPLGSLLIVVGGMLVAMWFLKNRIGRTVGMGGHRRIQVVEKVAVGQRQYLALIRIDNEEIFVGISPERITELGFMRQTGCGKTTTTQGCATAFDEASRKL